MIRKLFKERDKNLRPVWFMRQAGRHLIKYHDIRNKYKNFVDFCLDTNGVIDATLLPLKYYNIDAAILFSDILILPHLLGQKVAFIKGKGPVLSSVNLNESFLNRNVDYSILSPIKKAIESISFKLNKKQDLIGFCGAPWTLSCYMIERSTSKDFNKTRLFLWNNERAFDDLINKLTNECINLLELQYNSGANVLMIFDTWSSMIPYRYWKKYGIDTIKTIVKGLRKKNILCPIIGFPYKCGENIIQYSYESDVDIISLDWKINLKWVLKNVNQNLITQGNLDPMLLASDNKSMIEKEVHNLLNLTQNRLHIFNVGHGLTPETKKENVKNVIAIIKDS